METGKFVHSYRSFIPFSLTFLQAASAAMAIVEVGRVEREANSFWCKFVSSIPTMSPLTDVESE